MSDEDRVNVAATLQDLLRRHKQLFAESLTPRQRKVLAAFSSFAQQPDDYFNEAPVTTQAGAPGASAEIFGILKQMKESFETNLAASQKEEVTNVGTYEDLKSAKEAEIAAAQDQVETKSGQMATADEKRATDKEDLSDTQATP